MDKNRSLYIVYVLRSEKDGKRYIGYTSDLARRLNEHNSGKTISTKNRRPFILIYQEEYSTKAEAMEREKFFKSGKGREELKKIESVILDGNISLAIKKE